MCRFLKWLPRCRCAVDARRCIRERRVQANERQQGSCHLKRSALILVGVYPRTQGEFVDEHLAGLGEQHRRLRADHLIVRGNDVGRAEEGRAACRLWDQTLTSSSNFMIFLIRASGRVHLLCLN